MPVAIHTLIVEPAPKDSYTEYNKCDNKTPPIMCLCLLGLSNLSTEYLGSIAGGSGAPIITHVIRMIG